MAVECSDQWRNFLGKHELFVKLRQNVEAEVLRSSRTLNKNLFFCLDDDFFAWDEKNSVLYTTSLRNLNTENPELSDFKTLLCINPPLFEVDYLLVNPSQHYVALVGAKGLTVLALPKRWGKRSEFEGGKSKINCRTIPVAERLFTSSTSLVLRHAAWYPDESEEPHLLLLLGDNILRLYSLKDPHSPVRTLSLSQSEDQSLSNARGTSYTASLGEVAVAFDFGPLVEVSTVLLGQKGKASLFAYPLYILYENGETSLTYVSISHSNVNIGKLQGPLPMYPPAEDNYGYYACAILCLSHVPNVLVIATESGLLYHCVVLEAEEDDDQTFTESWDSKLELVPSLYVFECVTLELALKLAPGEDEQLESDFTCPIKLHRDPLCNIRYHCTHEAGVHTVGLMWISKLQKYIHSGDEDKDSLQELAAEQKCIVEHILCTKPLPCRQSSPIKGFLIVPDLSLGATLVCVTSTYECIPRPILTVVRPSSPPLLCSEEDRGPVTSPLKALASDSFEKHIRNILSRVSANPVFIRSSDKDNAPPPQECLQLLSRATQVFREEYILKQDLAREEIQRRVKLLREQKEKQLEDLNHCREEKKDLREMAERLAEKYEEAREKQDDLIRRMKKVLHSFHMQLPVLSDSEKDMKKELQSINDQLRHLENKIKQIKMKMEYQKKQMDKQDIPRKASTPLSAYQKTCIQSVLKEENERIAEMVKQINDIKSRVTF